MFVGFLENFCNPALQHYRYTILSCGPYLGQLCGNALQHLLQHATFTWIRFIASVTSTQYGRLGTPGKTSPSQCQDPETDCEYHRVWFPSWTNCETSCSNHNTGILAVIRDIISSKRSRPDLGSTQPPIPWVLGNLPKRSNRPERKADHSPPSITQIKNDWNNTRVPTVRTSSWPGAGQLYPYFIPRQDLQVVFPFSQRFVLPNKASKQIKPLKPNIQLNHT